MKKLLAAAAAAVLLVQSVLLILSVFCRPPGTDEAWIAEWAWFEAREGHARSELFRGYCHYEDRVVLLHRLFVLLSSAVIRLAGFHLAMLRLTVVIEAAVLLFLVHRLVRRSEPDCPVSIQGTAMLFAFPIFFRAAGFFRPEILTTLLGFASFMCLRYSGGSGRTRRALGGLFAGLAVTNHMTGLCFLGAGASLLLWERRPGELLPYLAGAAVPLVPWFAEIAGYYDLYLFQASGELVRTKTFFSPLSPLLNLLREHERLFRNPWSISASSVVLAALLATSGETFRRHASLYRFLACTAVLLGALSSTKTVTYTVLLLPFGAACFAFAVADWMRGVRLVHCQRGRRILLGAVAAATLVLGLVSSVGTAAGGFCRPEEVNARAGDLIPDGSSCLAPVQFVFGQIGRLRIGSLYLWRTLSDDTDGLTMDGLIRYAGGRGTRYLVLDGCWEDRIDGCREFLEHPPGGVAVHRAGELSVVEVVSPVR